jgi:two-component system sensor histidine kinase CpxA
MRGLFLKIFILFWIAQSLIFVISTTLILGRRFPHPGQILEPGYNNLQEDSVLAANTFEKNGCPGLEQMDQTRRGTLGLLSLSGSSLCGPLTPSVPPGLIATDTLRAEPVGNNLMWASPVTSNSGKKYIYVLTVPRNQQQRRWYDDLLRFANPQLPVAIAVGGLTTFVLVLIFTRPVIRLRNAAKQLARGKLNTRVKETRWSGFLEGEEFVALEHDFNHMAERLESLVNAQKLLLRDVSHELRSPLARLSVALELSREDSDPTMSTHLDRIERETVRLNELIGQLLALSSMETAEGLNKSERVSLNQLLEEILPDAEYEAQQRGAGVELHSQGECEVEGRRELLYRAIENVVRNAIRYTESGSNVEIHLQKGTNGLAMLEISDRGPGIPESELQSIFRPFYRLDLARAAQTGGFGVGLAIAERAVKLHNGSIRASNRAGGGATIKISFPTAA